MKNPHKVLKDGVSQRDGKGGWLEFKVGEIIDLSPEAAHHLVTDGFAEPVSTKKAKTTKDKTEEAPE